jgi:hypothetical protein
MKMKEAHSTVIVCWMMRRREVRTRGSVDGTLIPTVAAMVVLVDRVEVERALKTLRLTTVT